MGAGGGGGVSMHETLVLTSLRLLQKLLSHGDDGFATSEAIKCRLPLAVPEYKLGSPLVGTYSRVGWAADPVYIRMEVCRCWAMSISSLEGTEAAAIWV